MSNENNTNEVAVAQTIQAIEVAQIIKDDGFKTVSFIYDLNNNPNNFVVIYKNKLKHQELNAGSFYEKLNQVCQLEGLGFILYGDNDTEKVAKGAIRNSLPKIDEIIIDPREKKGVVKKDGFIMFNKYSEPKIINHYKQYAQSKKIDDDFNNFDIDLETSSEKTVAVKKFKTVDEHFNWDLCPLWKYHITRLADPKLNPAKDADGNNVSSFDYFIKWNCHALTCDEKIGVAMMLISETHGTGKGVWVSGIPDYCFGRDYSAKVNNETFTSQFNSIINGKRFLNYDESKVEGHDRTKVEEKLKTLITEKDVMLRAMRKDQEEVASFCNILVNANYGVPYKLSNGDRRHTVFVTSQIPQRIAVRKDLGMRESEYIKQLFEQRDEFLKQLFTFEFDYADVRFNPLNTKAKRRIISGTSTSFDLFVDMARKCDINGIENVCMGLFKEEQLDRILDEVSGGFISNETSKVILEALRDSNGNMSPSQHKRFLDEKIGECERLNVKFDDGSAKKITIRKFPHFNQELFALVAKDTNIGENDKGEELAF